MSLTRTISRRAALKASIAGAAALGAGSLSRALAQEEPPKPSGRIPIIYDETVSFNELYDNPPMLGRAEAWRLPIVTAPDRRHDVVRLVNYDQVIPIYGAIHAEPPSGYAHNDVWFDVGDGFIHSSWIVPVREVYHEPEPIIGGGFWGEVTVPTSWQHWKPELHSIRYYDIAYGTVFRVVDRADEPDGRAWYRIVNDLDPRHHWWVQARHVRKIEREEVRPISADVPPEDKKIVVTLKDQLLVCYESEVPVFATRIASGTTFFDDSGNAHAFHTPYGEHYVQRKTPSRHMVGGNEINDMYDLPGVPWCLFFSLSGAAIHGTYWHNDYGHPRSHGCVNVTTDAARWVYRWATPSTPYSEEYHWTTAEERATATKIIVER